MAAYELYERRYQGNLRADLRANHKQYTLEVFGEHPLAGPVHVAPIETPALTDAEGWADAEVDRAATENWRRVLECPVCRQRGVPIRLVPDRDAWEVECQDCGQFTASGPAFVALGNAFFGDGSRHLLLRDLSYHLHARQDPSITFTVTAENWETLAREGTRQRKQAGA